MPSEPPPGSRINLFSLVTYLPEPLAEFIDHLRGELVPGCKLRAHVTHLVPRPLRDPDAANDHIREVFSRTEPFELHMGDIGIFTMSSVVYVTLTAGFERMKEVHGELNQGPAEFNEPYPYHPHITLAQQISPAQVPAVFEHAHYRWAEFRHRRAFLVDRAVFVQATNLQTWIDLEEHSLGWGGQE
jgi:2'-5' RNA ligase